MISISHTIPQTKVNELTASQIEIHYNINPNDDILSKTQSVTNLYSVGMPEELILKYTNLSLDPCADAQKWVENVKAKKEEERKVAKEQAKIEAEKMANADSSDNQNAQNKEKEQIEKENDKDKNAE